jgi:hypothetical protein
MGDDRWIKVLRVGVPIALAVAVVTWIGVGINSRPRPFFVILLLALIVTGLWVFFRDQGKIPRAVWMEGFRFAIWITCIGAIVANVYFLALSPTVWLPRRLMQIEPGKSEVLDRAARPHQFGAYVLSSDDKRVILLLDERRAVVEVAPDMVAPHPPICVPARSGWLTRKLFLRPVQLLGLEADPGSPYVTCPKASPEVIAFLLEGAAEAHG